MSAAAGAQALRLFFAVWPPAEIQARLAATGAELQRELGGKSTREESIHLTLVFLGSVEAARVEPVVAMGQSVRCPRFTLPIERCGSFKGNGIGWAGPMVTPEPLAALAAGLQSGSRALGFAVDERPYHAHLTLVRKAQRPLRTRPLAEPMSWPVEEFVLVCSELGGPGSRYSVLHRFPCSS